MERFQHAWLKLERANHHIADLNAAIRSVEKTYTSTVENNLDTGHQELKHMFPDFENVALRLGLIVGDTIHNMHSALDFAWMSTLTKHVPSANFRQAKFPVYDTRKTLEDALNGIEINTITNNALFDR